MDFLERIFHLSPDGGSGLSEAGILIFIIFLVVGVASWWTGQRAGREALGSETAEQRSFGSDF